MAAVDFLYYKRNNDFRAVSNISSFLNFVSLITDIVKDTVWSKCLDRKHIQPASLICTHVDMSCWVLKSQLFGELRNQ